MDCKNAGVDIEAGYKSVELMKKHVQQTMRPEVLTGLGGFSGAFSMEKFKDMEKPTLVSGTDGVGTKLKLAFLLDRHDTIGFPGLYCLRKKFSGKDSYHCKRCGRRLYTERRGVNRRGNGGNAGLLSGR